MLWNRACNISLVLRVCGLIVLAAACVSGSQGIASSWQGPAYFEPNPDLTQTGVKYVAQGGAYRLEITENALVMRYAADRAVRMELPAARLQPLDFVLGSAIDYSGRSLQTNHFARFRYKALFPGIDLDVYWRNGEPEYDWIVQPRAAPSLIHVSFSGAEGVQVDELGDLVIRTRRGFARHRSPRAYTESGGIRREVSARFAVDASGAVSFQLGPYDHRRRLVIDPQLEWVTALGSYIRYDSLTLHVQVDDAATAIATDPAGNIYLAGTAITHQIPLVQPVQSSCSNNHCLFVTKLSPDGQKVLYSTYLGTPARFFPFPLTDGTEILPASIAVDPDGNAYVTGMAETLPQAGGGILQSAGGNDAFVAKLDPSGALKGSVLIGGSGDDRGTSISLGADGNLYVAGTTQSTDFPISPGAYRAPISGPLNFFAVKINPRAIGNETPFSRLLSYAAILGTYSTTSTFAGFAGTARIDADSRGEAYVSMYTDCTGIQATPGTVHASCVAAPSSVAVVVKMNPGGTSLLWVAAPTGSGVSTIQGLRVTPDGFVFLAGNTQSIDFPVTPGAYLATRKSSGGLSFLSKLNPEGSSFAYSTYLDLGSTSSLALDATGHAYVGGSTTSADRFPALNSIQSALKICCTGFVTAVKADGSGFVWSSLLGYYANAYAVTVDTLGNVYAVGWNLNPGRIATVINYGSTISLVKIGPDGIPFPIDAVTSAASFQPGVSKAGGLSSLFVHGLPERDSVAVPGPSLPFDLAGVSILVNGVPAPILSITTIAGAGPASTQQINFQVPFEAPQQFYLPVELRFQGTSSFGLPMTVAPGIFTLPDGSGAIQHALDYRLVTAQNPASPGETIIVYLTGLGSVRPPVATGTAATAPTPIFGYCHTPPTVNVGDVLYAGLTPGFAGLYQMNVRLSSSLQSGPTPLYVTWTDCQQNHSNYQPVTYITSDSNSVLLPIK